MLMSLVTYKAKRDFRKTTEPKAKQAKPSRKPIFVVQEHHASRLHWDFRLEAGGVLKSWAVPKEPTLDPSVKRLAVHVEDHPLEYAKFEGTIPEGEYGAGTVKIWDSGTYENLMASKPKPQTVSEAIESGHVEVKLEGKRLKGEFALVRTKFGGAGKDYWLLIKMKDEYARPESEQAETREKSESKTPARKVTAKASARPAKKSTAAPDLRSKEKPRSDAPRDDAEVDAPRRARSRGAKAKNARKSGSARGPKKSGSADPPAEFHEFTHTDKIMFPEAGLTKGDVLEFYERIADRLLPFLRDRPITAERWPDGLAGAQSAHFWQKDTPSYYPDWIPRVVLPSAEGKQVHYVLVNDKATLLYLVNQGTLTLHVWLSRVSNLDRPDFVLFDIDRSQATTADVVEVAKAVHEVVEAEGHEAYVKTTGKTGLHVLVPWEADGGYDASRAWALSVAERVAAANPDRATVAIRKAQRGRRVYIDVMQNARGHHAVPPYVLRAVPAASVSTPLTWRELTPDLDPAAFTVKTIFRRLARQKRDPMAGLVARWGG
jgi:bifunctional non-homologous end joining protein LigD